MLQINWEIYSSMIIKRFGCAAIHNKALYKCIIHSVVHEVNVYCMCSEHHSWFISFKLACTCSNSNLNGVNYSQLFCSQLVVHWFAVAHVMVSLGMKSQREACFINSVIQCMTGLCSTADKSASLLEKRLRNSRSSQTGSGNISGVQISRDKENMIRATILHIILLKLVLYG